MLELRAAGAAWVRRAAGAVMVAGAMGLGGCASMYVDGNLPETPKTEFRKPAQPPAVQLVFEFQTKGTANPTATNLLKDRVQAQVKDSGLFASVSDKPAAGAGLLIVTVNNVPLTDDAYSKGFMAGLTFGLAGTTVADGYDASLRYSPPATGAATIRQQAKHIIHTSIGTGTPPPGAIKAASGDEAATTMLRQLLSRLLAGLSRDPAFPAGKAEALSNANEAAKAP